MRFRLAAAFALFALSAAAALAQGAQPVLIGRWEVIQAAIAPWIGDKVEMVRESEVKKLLKQRIVFAAKAMTSQYPVLNCSDATYEPTRMPPANLFQGALPDPHQAAFAKAIGFAGSEISGIDLACSTGRFSFHFRDRDTALFALDNVIYTIRRR